MKFIYSKAVIQSKRVQAFSVENHTYAACIRLQVEHKVGKSRAAVLLRYQRHQEKLLHGLIGRESSQITWIIIIRNIVNGLFSKPLELSWNFDLLNFTKNWNLNVNIKDHLMGITSWNSLYAWLNVTLKRKIIYL